MTFVSTFFMLCAVLFALSVQAQSDAMPTALTQQAGDATRGAASVRNREGGHCVLCHAVPGVAERMSGNIGPPFAGVGARLTVPQLRLRVVNNAALNPATIMPAYHVVGEATERSRVATAFIGKPVLPAQEIEDIVAYLATLK